MRKFAFVALVMGFALSVSAQAAEKVETFSLDNATKKWALDVVDIKDAAIPVLEKLKNNRCGTLSNPGSRSLCEAAYELMIARRLVERAEAELMLASDQAPVNVAKPMLEVVSTRAHAKENTRSAVIASTIDQVFPAKTSALTQKGAKN